MQRLLRGLITPSLNWLFAFAPLAVLADWAHGRDHAWATPTLIFVASAIAIIPMAGWMGRATEHLATRLGEGVGGLLNATFGNAAEMIIALMALVEATRNPHRAPQMHDIVKASLTGSIIGNILLVLGAAILAGGLKFRMQTFNTTGVRAGATLLNLAAIALVIPAVLAAFVPEQAELRDVSLELSVLLLAAYGCSLLFTLRTHRHLYAGDTSPAENDAPEEEVDHHAWSVRRSMGVLLAATAGVTVVAELMVGSVEAASHALGLTELFVGIVVVAVVGNAAEHSTAVLVAWRNRMDLSLAICIGSSIQIALFAAPALVLISFCMGTPMDLVFTLPEVLALVLSVYVVGQIAGDGRSNWLEGVLLLMVYAVVGLLFYHLPPP